MDGKEHSSLLKLHTSVCNMPRKFVNDNLHNNSKHIDVFRG